MHIAIAQVRLCLQSCGTPQDMSGTLAIAGWDNLEVCSSYFGLD